MVTHSEEKLIFEIAGWEEGGFRGAFEAFHWRGVNDLLWQFILVRDHMPSSDPLVIRSRKPRSPYRIFWRNEDNRPYISVVKNYLQMHCLFQSASIPKAIKIGRLQRK